MKKLSMTATLRAGRSGLILTGFLCSMMMISSCHQGDLFERLHNNKKGEWRAADTPSFSFVIRDTVATYNVFVTIRHTNSYAYNNLWVEAALQLPGDSLLTQKLDLQLAGPEGWLGSGMDDIFESRIKITAVPQRFKRSGTVNFSLRQIMRQDPLPGVMQVGIRVEKAT